MWQEAFGLLDEAGDQGHRGEVVASHAPRRSARAARASSIRSIRHVGHAVLVDQPVEDPLDRVPLFARRVQVCSRISSMTGLIRSNFDARRCTCARAHVRASRHGHPGGSPRRARPATSVASERSLCHSTRSRPTATLQPRSNPTNTSTLTAPGAVRTNEHPRSHHTDRTTLRTGVAAHRLVEKARAWAERAEGAH
jgi:hypothetical protein